MYHKKISDFKSKICFKDGFISQIDGNSIEKTDYGCAEIRSENFLPDDSIEGRFLTKYDWAIKDFSAWDENSGRFPDDKLIELISFVIPNCTL